MTLRVSGPEILVNHDATTGAMRPALGATSDGGFWVAWTSTALQASATSFARRFDGSGNPVSGDVSVPTFNNARSGESAVDLDVLPDGSFVVTTNFGVSVPPFFSAGTNAYLFDGNGGLASRTTVGSRTDTGTLNSVDVLGDRFLTAGIFNTPERLLVSFLDDRTGSGQLLDTISVPPAARFDDAAIAPLRDGSGFMVAWSNGPINDNDIHAQLYTSAGVARGPAFAVNTEVTAGNQHDVVLEGLASGGFLAVWSDAARDGSGTGLYGQIFSSDGTRTGGEFRINNVTTGNQSLNDIAALPGGGFVAAWVDSSLDPTAFTSGVIRVQQFDGNGSRVGDELVLDSGTAVIPPALELLSDGRLIVGWSDSQVNNAPIMRLQLLDVTATPTSVGTAGPDLILGGNGDDILAGGAGRDVIDGGPGNDVLDGGADQDIIGGKDGNDLIAGGSETDYLDGGAGRDYIVAGSGDDLLIGGTGTDTLFGNEGSDIFYYRAGDGVDVIGDFTPGGTADVIDLIGTEYTSFAQVQSHLSFYEAGRATVLTFSNGEQILIAGVQPTQLDASDFWFNVQ